MARESLTLDTGMLELLITPPSSLLAGMFLLHLQSRLVLGSLQFLDLVFLFIRSLTRHSLVVDVHDELIQPTITSLLVGKLLATLVRLDQKSVGLLSMISRCTNTIMKSFGEHRKQLVERHAKLRFRVDPEYKSQP